MMLINAEYIFGTYTRPSFSYGCYLMLLTGLLFLFFSTQIFLSILVLLLGFGTIVQLQLIPLVQSYLQGTVLIRGTCK